MSPEATLLCVNAVFLAFAYLWVYPALPEKTARTILRHDLAISAAALAVAGLLFAGAGIGFSLLVTDVPWWLFSIVSFALIELPVWEWFRRRHGISYDDFLDEDDRDDD